jgi:hypothetical protein
VKDGVATLVDDGREVRVPLEVREGRGFAAVRALAPAVQSIQWDPARSMVLIAAPAAEAT